MSTINEIPDDEIFAELRRRNTSQQDVWSAMRWPVATGVRRPERMLALGVLSVLGLALVAVISYLTINSPKDPPSLLSGFAGTCIGAIAGILTGKPADQPEADTSS